MLYFNYVQRSCSSLYSLLRFTNRPIYITLQVNHRVQCQLWPTQLEVNKTNQIAERNSQRSQGENPLWNYEWLSEAKPFVRTCAKFFIWIEFGYITQIEQNTIKTNESENKMLVV